MTAWAPGYTWSGVEGEPPWPVIPGPRNDLVYLPMPVVEVVKERGPIHLPAALGLGAAADEVASEAQARNGRRRSADLPGDDPLSLPHRRH
jgi:hypothetical protein